MSRNSKELERIISDGDKWLRNYMGSELGVDTNDVVVDMYDEFPFIKSHEYWVPQDPEMRFIKINIYISTWKLLFMNRDKLLEDLEYFIKTYLPHHDIVLTIKRHKKGYNKG